jgi:hypothetical protein
VTTGSRPLSLVVRRLHAVEPASVRPYLNRSRYRRASLASPGVLAMRWGRRDRVLSLRHARSARVLSLRRARSARVLSLHRARSARVLSLHRARTARCLSLRCARSAPLVTPCSKRSGPPTTTPCSKRSVLSRRRARSARAPLPGAFSNRSGSSTWAVPDSPGSFALFRAESGGPSPSAALSRTEGASIRLGTRRSTSFHVVPSSRPCRVLPTVREGSAVRTRRVLADVSGGPPGLSGRSVKARRGPCAG